MGRRRGFGKIKKIKVAPFELIDGDAKPLPEPYRLMAQVRKDWHPDIEDAKIALAWRKGFKADKDGHLCLGKCIKAAELQKEFIEYDFIILLNFEVWNEKEFTKEKKIALLDHELCHAGESLDKEGEPKVDGKGRRVWRIVQHDIQEFHAIVRRHGTYMKDLERFAEALLAHKQKSIPFPAEEKPAEAAAVVN